MSDTPNRPRKGQAGWMWRLRIGWMPAEVLVTQNAKGDRRWTLSSGTDLWSVVGSKELKTWAKTKGVGNSFDRRQRSKSIGHVEHHVPTGKKAKKAWEARRRQTDALQASLAGISHPSLSPQPIPPPRSPLTVYSSPFLTYSSNHHTACQNACSFANRAFLPDKSPLTPNPCSTSE
jgi:hypothetical protein